MTANLDPPIPETLRLLIYRRPIHPELFHIYLEKQVRTRCYEADLWLLGLGHLACFHTAGGTVTELLVPQTAELPASGLVETFTLGGKQEYELALDRKLYYVVTVEPEVMSEPVFDRVYEEMVRFGRRRGLFIQFSQWQGEAAVPPFSLIEYEHRRRDLGTYVYHAFPDRRLLIRTQSIFSRDPIRAALPPKPAAGDASPSGGA